MTSSTIYLAQVIDMKLGVQYGAYKTADQAAEDAVRMNTKEGRYRYYMELLPHSPMRGEK